MKASEIQEKTAPAILYHHSEFAKESYYAECMRTKAIYVGRSVYDDIDWSHQEMLLSTVKWKECKTLLEVIHEFWRNHWPYLRNLIKAYEETRGVLHAEWEEQDKILKKYAEAETDRKLRKEYLSQQGLEDEYQYWKSQFNSARRDIQESINQEAKRNS